MISPGPRPASSAAAPSQIQAWPDSPGSHQGCRWSLEAIPSNPARSARTACSSNSPGGNCSCEQKWKYSTRCLLMSSAYPGYVNPPEALGLQPSAAATALGLHVRPRCSDEPYDRARPWAASSRSANASRADPGPASAHAAYLVIAVWFLTIVVWGTAEHFLDKETFPTVWLGMWWALQTVTTVGYGDVVPQDELGRAVASVLLLGGLAFISVITATITSGFVALRQRQAREAGEDPVVRRAHPDAARLRGPQRQPSALRGSPPADR